MDRRTLKAIAVQFNRGSVRGSSAHLARIMGVSVPTVRSWMSDPEDEKNYRGMTRGARRLLAVMVLLDGARLLDEDMIAAINKLEALLKEGDGGSLKRTIKVLQGTADDDDNVDENED